LACGADARRIRDIRGVRDTLFGWGAAITPGVKDALTTTAYWILYLTTTNSMPTCAVGSRASLTRDQIVEALTHLGFYAGWSKATKAMTAVTRSLGK
jgi:hypothetical protein